jgi:hypothetical protein
MCKVEVNCECEHCKYNEYGICKKKFIQIPECEDMEMKE